MLDNFKISAVYITKNEAKNIKQSIESCKDIVDEIIVLDTGSTDNTIQICKDLGCEVFEYVWENDFSKARNIALEHVHYPYILFLDADEYFENKLEIKDKEYLSKIMTSNKNIEGLNFLTHNYDSDDNRFLYDSYNLKFFINDKSLNYKRCVHEKLTINNRPLNSALVTDLVLIHTGYSSKISIKKVKRNLNILNSLESKETMDYFYIARENLSLMNYEECDKNCDIFLEQEDAEKLIKEKDIAYLIYFYKYSVMGKLENKYSQEDRENLLDIILKKFPDIPQSYYEKAVFEHERDYKLAYSYYIKAIECNNKFNLFDGYINMYSTFESDIYYRLSCIDGILGNKSQAITRAKVACMLDKYNVLYLQNLLKRLNNNDPNKIIQEIYKIYQPKITSDYNVIIKALANTKLNAVFVYFLSEYNVKYNGGSKLVYIGMMLSNQCELAIETALSIYEKSGNIENQFIATMAILYSNNLVYYNKYLNRFKIQYQNILKFHFENNIRLSEEEFSEYMNLYIRLYFVGKENTLKFSIDYFSTNDLSNLLYAYESINDYKSIIDLCNLILDNDLNEDIKKIAINKIVVSYFATKKTSKLLEFCKKYSSYIPSYSIKNFIQNLNSLSDNDKLIKKEILEIIKRY